MRYRVLAATMAMVVAVGLIAGGIITSASAEDQKQAKVGEPAPQFSLQDENGNTVSLSQFQDKIVVLEWCNAGCPVWRDCYKRSVMKDVWQKYKDSEQVVWLLVNSTAGTDAEANAKIAEEYEIEGRPILDDHTGEVGKLYGARTTPHMYVIDRDGTLAYNGAIDNQEKGEDYANYVDQAVSELLAGEEVSTPKTKPYGCGIKYARN